MDNNPVHQMMQQGLCERVYPGAVLYVGKDDSPLFFEAYGQANLFTGEPMTRETVFDLASLTKPLATTLAVARLVDQGRLGLDQPVGEVLEAFTRSDKAPITIRQLLCHQSGFDAHRRFYMTLKSLAPAKRKAAVLDLLLREPLAGVPGNKILYSDLGFMLLCRVVEFVAACPIHRYLRSEIYGPLCLDDLFFVDLTSEERPGRLYAATELCPVRNRLLVGEVHDDNAWFAGGIDGHAGLFGTASAIHRLLRALVADLRGHSSQPILSKNILSHVFHGSRKNPLPLGFDRPSVENSSAGCYFSPDTVGHLGFTGVSFWMDLDSDITIILLTNRVHPFRWNFTLRRFRPILHDRVMEHFEI